MTSRHARLKETALSRSLAHLDGQKEATFAVDRRRRRRGWARKDKRLQGIEKEAGPASLL